MHVKVYTHGERQEHYRQQLGVYALPIEQRPPVDRLAWEQATAEMLDEIHALLRAIRRDG